MELLDLNLIRVPPMPACQISPLSTISAATRLEEFIRSVRADGPVPDFQAFEFALHEVILDLEREVLQAELARLDIDAPVVFIAGVEFRRVLRSGTAYLTRAGEARVERSLYRARGEERTVCPLELRAGVVESYWTPAAAMLSAWSVAHLTPQETQEFFERVGGMKPSRSSLDRLPKALSCRWEEQRPHFEDAIIAAEVVPELAVAVAVSLDGVLLPMKDGKRQQKRAASRSRGKEVRGPAGYREASSGTLTFYDADGERIGLTRYLGRMPEKNKRTLKESLDAELLAILTQRPDLVVVAVADGAKDNWTWLVNVLPAGAVQVLDFFHAAEHLKRALDNAHGQDSPKARAEFERLRLLLRDHDLGVNKVIDALAYQHRKHPRRRILARELRYFRNNKARMDYAAAKARRLPIGSGVVEAANKTLVSVRMKRAGSRWSIEGGQAILTLRALAKSHRFDRAWELLGGTYKVDVGPPETPAVTPLRLAA